MSDNCGCSFVAIEHRDAAHRSGMRRHGRQHPGDQGGGGELPAQPHRFPRSLPGLLGYVSTLGASFRITDWFTRLLCYGNACTSPDYSWRP